MELPVTMSSVVLAETIASVAMQVMILCTVTPGLIFYKAVMATIFLWTVLTGRHFKEMQEMIN